MSTTIYKLSDGTFMLWNDSAKAPETWECTREEMAAYLREREITDLMERIDRDIANRLDRTEERGTSSFLGGPRGGLIYQQKGIVSMDNMLAFLATFNSETQEFDPSFITPFEDD